jgi:hypothetical protein
MAPALVVGLRLLEEQLAPQSVAEGIRAYVLIPAHSIADAQRWESGEEYQRSLDGVFEKARELGQQVGKDPDSIGSMWQDLLGPDAEESPSLQDPRFRLVVAKISSVIRKKPLDDMIGEDITQHRITKIAIISVTMLLLGLTGYSTYKTLEEQKRRIEADAARRQAQRQERIAVSRKLAIESETVRTISPRLLTSSVVLGVEAVRKYPTPEAR